MGARSGGPAVDEGGTVYVASTGGTLYALSAGGGELWHTTLAAQPVGAPALSGFGDIYVADLTGGLEVFDRDGRSLWSTPGDGYPAIAGPIVAADNTAFYPTEGHVVAVTGEGRVKWRVNLPFYSYNFPLLSLSPDGQYVFFEDVAFDASDGAVLTKRTLDPFDRFFVGVDAKVYLGGASALLEWRTTERGAEIVPRAQFDARALALGFRALQVAGISPDQQVWMLFNSPFEHAKLVWFDMSGNLRQAVDTPFSFGWLVSTDGDSNFYLCGLVDQEGFQCRGMAPGATAPLWKLPLPAVQGAIDGGALVPGRLYVTTTGGDLYAIDYDGK
jgi:outer membrane protein assembly factor BamB